MSENAIVSKIEIDGSHNIVFLSVKDVPGIESIIEEVQKYVTMHIEKYTKMSANCESKGAFAAGMIGASFYKNYKTAYLVLCIPKVEGEVATGHQIYTKDNINELSIDTLQNFIINSISYAFLCSHNDSIFDIWDVCVDHTVRTVPGTPSHKAGTRMTKGCLTFVDILIRHFIPKTIENFGAEGILYPGDIDNTISLPVTVELFARKDNIPAIKAYINAGLNDHTKEPVYVTNMPWLLRAGYGPLDQELEFVFLSYTYKYSLNPIQTSDTVIRYRLEDKVIKDDYNIDAAELKTIKDNYIKKIK